MVGLAIPTIVYPIVEEVVEIAVSGLEIIKGKEVKKITEMNIENAKLAAELDSESECDCCTNAIGFEVPDVTEYEDDDEYYEDE